MEQQEKGFKKKIDFSDPVWDEFNDMLIAMEIDRKRKANMTVAELMERLQAAGHIGE